MMQNGAFIFGSSQSGRILEALWCGSGLPTSSSRAHRSPYGMSLRLFEHARIPPLPGSREKAMPASPGPQPSPVFHPPQRTPRRRCPAPGPCLPSRRNFQQFGNLGPQGLKIGFFGFRIIYRLFCEFGCRWIALEHFELLLDRSRETCSCIYEHVQCCAGKCWCNEANEHDRPKHRAIISDSVGPRRSR